MREMIIKLVTFAVVLFFIYGIFWGVKRQNWITIEQMNNSMDPDYPPGTHNIGLPPLSQDELVIGKAYAFIVQGSGEREKRVAWLVAKQGQRVEFKDKSIYVNGAKTDCKINLPYLRLAPFVVPQGTVYLVSTMPDKDSLTIGPIPFRNVLGQM